jgi:hypothetical protein
MGKASHASSAFLLCVPAAGMAIVTGHARGVWDECMKVRASRQQKCAMTYSQWEWCHTLFRTSVMGRGLLNGMGSSGQESSALCR